MRYPVSHLPKAISTAIEAELLQRKYYLPTLLEVIPATEYMYHMVGVENKAGFVIEASLALRKELTTDLASTMRSLCQKNGYYVVYSSYWGTWGGALGYGDNPVNSSKVKRTLLPGNVVIKCYVDKTTRGTKGKVLFHPTELPPIIPTLRLSDRDRMLLFAFAKLKEGSELTLALDRLQVSDSEIQSLITKQAIRQSKNGYSVTVAGLAAQSESPKLDRW